MRIFKLSKKTQKFQNTNSKSQKRLLVLTIFNNRFVQTLSLWTADDGINPIDIVEQGGIYAVHICVGAPNAETNHGGQFRIFANQRSATVALTSVNAARLETKTQMLVAQ